MKKLFLVLFMLIGVLSFAQVATETPTQTKTVLDLLKTLVLPVVIAQVLVLVSDAGKYIKAGEFVFSIFFTSKIKPFLITHVLSIVLVALYVFVPYFTMLFTTFTGSELVMTSFGLYAAVTALVDGFLKKTI